MLPRNNFILLQLHRKTYIIREISLLDPNKSVNLDTIPSQTLRDSSDISARNLLNIWNNKILGNKVFTQELKLANVTPIFKIDDATLCKNYRPISVLSSTSKIFERIIQNQLVTFIEEFISPNLCGYRKPFSMQDALVTHVEKWKKVIDNAGYTGAILMDLSQAFDTINHELVIAKLHAYGVDRASLEIMHSYLTNRWQRTKINETFNTWSELIYLSSILENTTFFTFCFHLCYSWLVHRVDIFFHKQSLLNHLSLTRR